VNSLSAPVQFGQGTARIVDGTGSYSGIRGRATFDVVADFLREPPTITGTLVGRPRDRGDDAEDDEPKEE
jgi:hypothetical protein